ncbi:hypothetical protein PVAND_016906 [Polypedilum vanderplanki]|uniref:Uncharacterized protein n=1 Tax=Polypedilum vanderplanki TaxID=319348 RepID=A0A9J6BHK1_POLVA|nr:hypothetical protein PVAND_016906 [Polypedilum vanderplanki]
MSCVEVKNVFKSYWNGGKEEKILNGINMNVDEGTIYALIGASGCGKTTLLSCLMGVQKPQSGELKVFNRKSTEVSKLIGFMPQHNSLVAELTIIETLQYFSRLYEMDNDTFYERFNMIRRLLELPQSNLKIQNLSGGQQRRVSLAATIIHNPKLLILDEPTVGLDFLLREKIWNFLIEKTENEGLTTIITTHYISEAANAHRCGFMRKGILISEDEPRKILRNLNVGSLDEAFYELCTKEYFGNQNIIENRQERKNVGADDELENDKRIFRYKILKGLLVKEFHRMKRNYLEIFLVLILPIFQIIIFNNCIGLMPTDLKFGVINYENQHCKNQTINNNSILSEECPNSTFSCELINQINNKNIETIFYDSNLQAIEDFKIRNIFTLIEIPENFTKIIFDESNEKFGEISVSIDNLKHPVIFFAKAKIIESFFDFMGKLAEKCDVNEFIRTKPMRFFELFGKLDYDSRTTMMTAIVISTPFTMTNIFALLIISDTRIAGVWNRTLLCGVNVAEIILARIIECLLIAFILAISMMTCLNIYGIEIVGSSLLIFIIMIEIAVVGFMLGFLISIIFDKFQASSGVGQIILVLGIFTGGIFWPIESLSTWIKPISYVHPLTFVILAVRNVIIKGFSFYQPSVLLGLAVVNSWIIFLAILSYFVLEKRKFSKI